MYQTRIYYQDTDAGGVVYFANYLKFVEKSWFEFLYSIGINLPEWEKLDTYLIVRTVHLELIDKVRYGDFITVKTSVKDVKNAYFVLTHDIFRDQKPTTKIETTMVCINSEGRPKRIPVDFKERLFNAIKKTKQSLE